MKEKSKTVQGTQKRSGVMEQSSDHVQIPIVIGVTGHRDIRNCDREILYASVCKALRNLKAQCPHSTIIMLNSLARGGDQLCAQAAMELSIPVVAVLPMDRVEYEKDFSGEDLSAFCSLYDYATEHFISPCTEKRDDMGEREFAYRQAGIYIATRSHVLLSLWDGKPGKSGCGTAEAVEFAAGASFSETDSVSLRHPGFVIHIYAPRAGSEVDSNVGSVRFLGDQAAFNQIMNQTDEFNHLAARVRSEKSDFLPTDRQPDENLDRLESLYHAADALSLRYGKRYRRILGLLALVSTIITVAFLLYDEAELHWMILVCGIMLLIAWLLVRFGSRSACHRRYLEFRTLAESLRVQAFLRYAGSPLTVSSLFPWSTRMETRWIVSALDILSIASIPYPFHAIRTCWIEQQEHYHHDALQKSKKPNSINDRLIAVALSISVTLYLLVLVLELVWSGRFPILWKLADPEPVRTLAKLLLGSISAATLFIANYYGKLSLSHVVRDHEKMEQFYHNMANKIDFAGQTDMLLSLLAREELVENANWCAHQRANSIDFSL